MLAASTRYTRSLSGGVTVFLGRELSLFPFGGATLFFSEKFSRSSVLFLCPVVNRWSLKLTACVPSISTSASGSVRFVSLFKISRGVELYGFHKCVECLRQGLPRTRPTLSARPLSGAMLRFLTKTFLAFGGWVGLTRAAHFWDLRVGKLLSKE